MCYTVDAVGKYVGLGVVPLSVNQVPELPINTVLWQDTDRSLEHNQINRKTNQEEYCYANHHVLKALFNITP